MARKASKGTANDCSERLATAARMLIETLGEETASAVAGKCIVTYARHRPDLEAAAMGVERYNAI